MFPFDSLRYRYTRWRALHDAEQGLPPLTKEDRAAIAELRSAFRQVPVNVLAGMTPTEADWAEAMNRLRELALQADPRAFQRWDVIAARMAHTSSPATAVELAALRAHEDWTSRWRDVLHDVPAGRPVPYVPLAGSSEPLIQTVHHVMQLERMTARRVDSWDVVVEFGGGFGGLCRVMHALGFRGRYLIYDLPPIVLLQRYYLERVGLGAASGARVRATDDFAELERFVDAMAPGDASLFWATWSLSEAPVALRERMKPLVSRMRQYFIGYQAQYGEVNNVDYFSNHWIAGASVTERIAHRPNDYYVAGDGSTPSRVSAPSLPDPVNFREPRSDK